MITLQLHYTSNDSRTLLHIANCTEISHDSHIRYDNPRSPHVGSELDVAHMHGTPSTPLTLPSRSIAYHSVPPSSKHACIHPSPSPWSTSVFIAYSFLSPSFD